MINLVYLLMMFSSEKRKSDEEPPGWGAWGPPIASADELPSAPPKKVPPAPAKCRPEAEPWAAWSAAASWAAANLQNTKTPRSKFSYKVSEITELSVGPLQTTQMN